MPRAACCQEWLINSAEKCAWCCLTGLKPHPADHVLPKTGAETLEDTLFVPAFEIVADGSLGDGDDDDTAAQGDGAGVFGDEGSGQGFPFVSDAGMAVEFGGAGFLHHSGDKI